MVDIARKVVGVGSVGTRAFIVLLQGRDERDPLFLQVKEATASVLEDHLPRSRYKKHGERVVHGQRMMQAASDIYLGWTKGVDVNRHYYWRQLRDMKGSADPETMAPFRLTVYARACGWTLAEHTPGRRPDRDHRLPGRKRPIRPSPSPSSPNATPTRTSWTSRRSSRRSAPDASRRRKASEPAVSMGGRGSERRGHRARRPGRAATEAASSQAACAHLAAISDRNDGLLRRRGSPNGTEDAG